jgi:hypothetical protein
MGLVQITERSGRVDRVPRGEKPVVELHLEENQSIVRFELQDGERYFDRPERKTVDWTWTATIATRLGPDF